MKKLYKLLSTIAFILLLGSSYSNATDVIIGTGTSTITSYPYISNFGGNKMQMIFTVTELVAAGMQPGEINSLAFYNNSASAIPAQNFRIRIKNTNLSQITTSFETGTFTTVYQATTTLSTLGTAPGWLQFTFTTPFLWDGSSNIIVETAWTNNTTTGLGSTPIRYTSTSPNYMTLYNNQDNVATIDDFASTGSRTYSRPNVKFGYSLLNYPYAILTPSIIELGYLDVNTTSSLHTVNITADLLTPASGNLVVTPGPNVSVRLTPTSPAVVAPNTLNIPYTGGSLASVPIYASLTSGAQADSYTGQFTITGGGLLAPKTVNINANGNLMSSYCTSGAIYTNDQDIGNFSIGENGSILNNGSATPLYSNSTANKQYTDFTVTIPPINLQAGMTYPVSVSIVNVGTYAYSSKVNLYIDYNRNGNFDLPDELAFTVPATGSGNSLTSDTWTGTISIPGNVNLGGNAQTLMRLVVDENDAAAPCGTYTWGETEDYLVQLIPPPPMTITSIDTMSVTQTAVQLGSTNQEIGALNVVTSGFSNRFNIKRLVFTNVGTANSNDIENVKVWMSNQSTFDTTATLFGILPTLGTGFNSVTKLASAPVIELDANNNYFFVTYDIKSTATIGNKIDLRIDTLVLNKTVSNVSIDTSLIVNKNPIGTREIKGPLNGIYTIGGPVLPTRYYPNLATAIEDLYILGINADVEFAIAANQTLVSGTSYSLPPVNNIGGEYNITIYPKNAARTITGNFSASSSNYNGLITFAGIDRVIIDGRINKTGTTRGLSFINNSSAIYNRVFSFSGDSTNNTDSRDITIKYTNITGFDKTSSSGAGIYVRGKGLENIYIDNNYISNSYYGIYTYYITSASYSILNFNVTNNLIGNPNDLATSIGYGPLYLYSLDSSKIEGNTITNVKNSSSISGILLSTYINGLTINNNIINKIYSTGTNRADAINISTSSDSNIVISNNRISEILGNGTSTFASYGTFGIRAYLGTNIKIYHNTVVLEGNRSTIEGATSQPTTPSVPLYVGTVYNADVKNNIFINRTTNNNNQKTYAIYINSISTIPTLNYNNYYVSPESTEPVLAYVGSDKETLADLKTATGGDAQSKNIEVEFTEDFHLNGNSSLSNDLIAVPLTDATVLNDIDRLPRQVAPKTTQMGADEAIPNIAITQNLPKTIEGLCAPVEHTLAVQAALTGFSDGITRNVTNPEFIYQWKMNGTPITNMEITTDPETGEFDTTIINSNQYIVKLDKATPRAGVNYSVVVSGGGKTFESNIANIKAEEIIIITEQPLETAELCTENGQTTLKVAATGTVSGYQWQKLVNNTWANLNGETKDSLVVILGSPKFGPGSYRAVIFDGVNNCSGGQVVSNVSVLTAVEPLRNLVLTSPLLLENHIEVCEGTSINVNVDKELLTGNVFDFRWEQYKAGTWSTVDLSARPEFTEDGFEINNSLPEQSGIFRLVLIGSTLCDTKELASDSINILIKPFVKILNQPTAQILCKNNAIVLEVKAEGEGATYQWTKDGKPITAEENSTFDKPVFVIENATFDDSGVYGVLVKVIGCVPGRDDGVLVSDPATIYVMNETQIVSQPTNQHAILGKKAIFEVRTNAIGAAPDYVAEFQWFKGNAELRDDAKYAGAKSSILIIKNTDASDATAEYYLRIKGLCGDYIYTDRVHVIPATVAFTQQLADASACEGDSYKFSVLAETTYPNDELTYEWHFIDVNGVDAVLPSSTSNELSVIATPATSGTYYVLARLLQDGSSVKSNEAVFTVNSIPVITEPFAATTKATNESFTLTVLASGNNLEYKWYRDGALIANAVSSSYTGQEANPGTYAYTVEVLNGCGLVSTSANVTITAGPKVEVIEPIMGVTVSNVVPNPVVSHTASFSVTSDRAYPMTVSLIDAAGRNYGTLFDGVLSSSQDIIFNVTDLSSGAYYLNININGKVITRQIIVNK